MILEQVLLMINHLILKSDEFIVRTFASIPEALGIDHHSVNHAIMKGDSSLIVNTHVIPEAQDSAERVCCVSHILSACFMKKHFVCEINRVIIVEISHKRIQITTAFFRASRIGTSSSVPNLTHRRCIGRKSRIPRHCYTIILFAKIFSKNHKTFWVCYINLIGANMKIRTHRYRYLVTKFFNTFF